MPSYGNFSLQDDFRCMYRKPATCVHLTCVHAGEERGREWEHLWSLQLIKLNYGLTLYLNWVSRERCSYLAMEVIVIIFKKTNLWRCSIVGNLHKGNGEIRVPRYYILMA